MILVMIMSPLANFAEAHAIAIAAVGVAGIVVIIGAILVAGGLIVETQDQLRQIAQRVWDGIQSMGQDGELLVYELLAIHKAAFGAQSQGISAALHVSARLWDAIWSTHGAPNIVAGNFEMSDNVTYHNIPDAVTLVNTVNKRYTPQFMLNDTVYRVTCMQLSDQVWQWDLYRDDVRLTGSANFQPGSSFVGKLGLTFYNNKGLYLQVGAKKLNGVYDGIASRSLTCTYPVTLSFADVVSIPVTGDIALPAPDTLVKVPDLPKEDEKGEIAWPDIPLLPEDARIHDIPDAAGDLTIPDIPYDKVIDAATGAVVGDVDIPDVPIVPDLPSNADLSLPQLIITKFPFCIPFDLAHMIGLLAADPVEPVFRIPIKARGFIDEEIVLDFSQFSDLIAIIRWGEYIVFVGGLALVTRNYIKW